ncbi:MAG: S1C family serine protease [Dongiaceae bacterium]
MHIVRMRLATVVAVSIAVSGCASSANIQPVSDKPAIEVQSTEQTRPVQFRKIVIKFKRGEDIGALQAGLLCLSKADLTFRGGRMTLEDDELTEVFRDELEAANYQVVGDPDALFDDPSSWKAEYLIAGLVKRMEANICYPLLKFGNTDAKGEAFMEVEWQVYSRLDRQVVFKRATQGSSRVDDARPTGEVDVFLDAFAQATRNLLADKEFHALIAGQAKTTSQQKSVPETLVIANHDLLDGSLENNMKTVRTNVVTVFAGDGHGSGFMIDPHGYLLTNEHVVRTAERVKVRFASGRESIGRVVRTDTRRDVALVQIEDSQGGGLPLRTDRPEVGSEVYAVGSPLDVDLSMTVTKGIVSAYRVEDGMNLIQSDAEILPGNSGGPLLDSRGNVIGISASTILLPGGVPSGIGFFIPIMDALDSIGLRIQSAAL